MGKVLIGLLGSPRKHGNCELFTKEIFSQMGSGWELRLVRLPEFDIRPCRACYRCLFGDMRCSQDDDFLPVLDALADADAAVIAAPVYLLAANAGLKRFLDRGLQFYAFIDRLWGKPAVGVVVGGIEGMEGCAKLNVESFIKLTMGDLRGAAVVYGALPGETLLSEANRRVAARLAENLLNPSGVMETDVPVCPLCGGDTFRFLPDGMVRCMLCSGSGTYGWSEGRLQFKILPGAHPLFSSREDALRHAEWLRGMKEKYLARRKELKEVTTKYLGIGTWIGHEPREIHHPG